MKIKILHKNVAGVKHAMGAIPLWLDAFSSIEKAKDVFNRCYAHGGGWQKFEGHTLNKETYSISYPGDPPHKALAVIERGDEKIVIYDSAWVAIIQQDGSHEIARMD